MPGGRDPYADWGPPVITPAQTYSFNKGLAATGGAPAPGAGGPMYPGATTPGTSTGGTGGWATEFNQLLASLQPTMTQALEAGNVDPSQQAAKFAAGQQSNLASLIPGYAGMTGQMSGIITDQLAGKVPTAATNSLRQQIMEQTGGRGLIGPVSDASWNQAFGTNVLRQIQTGQDEYNKLVGLNKIDPQYLGMTPAQRAAQVTQLTGILADLASKLQNQALDAQTKFKLQQMANDTAIRVAQLRQLNSGGGGGQSGGGQRYGGGGGATGGATRGGISSVSDLLGGGGTTGGTPWTPDYSTPVWGETGYGTGGTVPGLTLPGYNTPPDNPYNPYAPTIDNASGWGFAGTPGWEGGIPATEGGWTPSQEEMDWNWATGG